MISVPSLVDARVHAAAVKQALNLSLAPKVQAFDYDEVPGSPLNPDENDRKKLPNIFVAISISRRPAPPTRGSYTTGRTGWRVTTRGVGRSTDECRWAMFRIAQGLNEAVLSIGGTDTTPVTFESEDDPAADDGRFSATSIWIYAH